MTTAISGDLHSRFNGPADGPDAPGGWWILFEPELHLGEDVIVPDWAGWRRHRLPDRDAAAATLAPDWVCEVMSPSTAQVDRTRKTRLYAREGVGHLWLVDPLLRCLEIYRLEDAAWVVVGNCCGDDVARATPFDAVEFRLARWWMD